LTEDNAEIILERATELEANKEPMRRELMKTLAAVLDIAGGNAGASGLHAYYRKLKAANAMLYNSFLYNEGAKSL
jgi:hypothetical protein